MSLGLGFINQPLTAGCEPQTQNIAPGFYICAKIHVMAIAEKSSQNGQKPKKISTKEAELTEIFDENGKRLSPVLLGDRRNFLIDIDGTVCDDVPNEEPERMGIVDPYPDALDVLNKWYDEGHIIYFFTSRTEAHRSITEEWLNKHGFKYHGILFGKPRGGNYHWIDNHIVRATRFKGKFTDLVMRKRDIEVFEE